MIVVTNYNLNEKYKYWNCLLIFYLGNQYIEF